VIFSIFEFRFRHVLPLSCYFPKPAEPEPTKIKGNGFSWPRIWESTPSSPHTHSWDRWLFCSMVFSSFDRN